MQDLVRQCIAWGKRLHDKSLVTARSGNISARAGHDRFLMTATGTYLFDLAPEDIVAVNAAGELVDGKKQPTSERRMHLAVYEAFGHEAQVVMHAHAPYTVAFFDKNEDLFCTSFEAEMYLGDVPVVEQDAPTVMDVDAVIDALRRNKIAVLGKHGVIAIGKDFAEAYSLIELLEEQAKLNIAVGSDAEYADAYKSPAELTVLEIKDLFTKRHCAALKKVLSHDDILVETAADQGIALSAAFVCGEQGIVFSFADGALVAVESGTEADLVLTLNASRAPLVFSGALNPLVAYTQGRATLARGDFDTLSRYFRTLQCVCDLLKCFDFADA